MKFRTGDRIVIRRWPDLRGTVTGFRRLKPGESNIAIKVPTVYYEVNVRRGGQPVHAGLYLARDLSYDTFEQLAALGSDVA